MSKLKSLLLAGAVIPALALTPMQAGYAQAPGPDGRPGMRGEGGGGGPAIRQLEGGASRGEGGGARGGPAVRALQGGPREEGGAGGAHGGRAAEGGAPRGGTRGEGGAGGGAAPRGFGESTRGGAGSERHAPAAAERAAPAAPAEGAAERRAQPHNAQSREDRAGRPVAPGGAAHGAAETQSPRGQREERTGGAAPGAEGTGGGAESRSPRGQHQQGREEQAPRAGTRNNSERGTAGAPAAAPTPRAGDNLDRTPSARGPNGGAPGVGDRGPGGPGDRGAGDRRFGDNPGGRDDRRRGGLSPAGAAAIGVAAGFAGGFMAGGAGVRGIDDVRRERREERDGDRTYIREPGRTIVEDGDRRFLVHDPNDRFRELGYRSNHERRGDNFVDTVVLAGGVTVLTYTTPDGRLLRRVRRGADGRDVVLFENDSRPVYDDVVDLPPPPMRIPRDRYVVDYADADEGSIYDTLVAPPLAPPPQRYTLDQVLYSPSVRNYVRSVDINTINFPTGQWVVPGDQTRKLVSLAQAINRAVSQNPNSVFLIEGYTDAVGNPTDNLSLSDHRAQSVASILTKDFKVPPENLTTQGYGDQNPKERTSGPSAANRRVVVRNITQLLAAGGNPPPR